MGTSPKSLDILLLLDVPYAPPEDQDFSQLIKTEDFKHERDVVRALERLGHKVRLFGVYDCILPLVNALNNDPPDLVFPQFEAFAGDRDLEPFVIGLLEILKIPYTGASPESSLLCKDKALSKSILESVGVRVPKFLVSRRDRPLQNMKDLPYPAICKPLGLEASEGISLASLVETPEAARRRTRYLHERFGKHVIIEEFIAGREIYMGIIGNERLTVLPPQELFFRKLAADEPRFATYKAKWDSSYRKRWGIDSGRAKKFSQLGQKKIDEVSKLIYRTFKLCGYARLDFRLSKDEELIFLEANPNPAIGRHDDFACAAKEAGISYDTLIQKIVSLALRAPAKATAKAS